MKKLLYFVISMLSIQTNAQLLQKIIFAPGTTDEIHYNFYENGLLKEKRKANGTLIQDFAYDANNNMILTHIAFPVSMTATYTFTYDANNHISNINSDNVGWPVNGVAIHFDTASSTYTNDPDITDSDTLYSYWKVNSELLLVQEWSNYLDEIQYTKYGISANYHNGNTSFNYDSDMVMNFWEHTNVSNPLRNASLPASRAMSLLFFGNGYGKMLDTSYVSANVEVNWDGHPDGPDAMEYTYELNANELPYKKHFKYYYVNSLESEGLSCVYYYQGDVIP